MAKVQAADLLFSRFIRGRDGWTCQKCHRKFKEGDPGLTCSHFFGRAKESTRFDPENCDALCRACHAYFEDRKGMTYKKHGKVIIEVAAEYRAWKEFQLGPRAFAALEVRAHTYAKKDRKMALLYVKALMADLKKRQPEVVGGKV